MGTPPKINIEPPNGKGKSSSKPSFSGSMSIFQGVDDHTRYFIDLLELFPCLANNISKIHCSLYLLERFRGILGTFHGEISRSFSPDRKMESAPEKLSKNPKYFTARVDSPILGIIHIRLFCDMWKFFSSIYTLQN